LEQKCTILTTLYLIGVKNTNMVATITGRGKKAPQHQDPYYRREKRESAQTRGSGITQAEVSHSNMMSYDYFR
jgi:hypothetical protein